MEELSAEDKKKAKLAKKEEKQKKKAEKKGKNAPKKGENDGEDRAFILKAGESVQDMRIRCSYFRLNCENGSFRALASYL